MTKISKIKQSVYKIARKPAGKRFIYAYSRINKFLGNNPLIKAFYMIFGCLLLFAGIVMLFIPGPGILFMLIGISLMCVASRRVAKFVDKTEKKARDSIR